MSPMERRRHDEVEARLHELARTHHSGELADALYDFSRELLDQGYPRGDLLERFKRLVLGLRESGDGEREDAALEVMDALTGWVALSARL